MKNYYTVSEFAEKTGKDPGNIRRLLIRGSIRGEKLGRQWIIPADEVYPEDGRVKSGEYKNWRKKVALGHSKPGLIRKLPQMSDWIALIYGERIDKIVLYGSYARGEQTEESDVDIAVVLRDGGTEKMHDMMLDVVVDYELELAVTLSVVPIEYENYIKWNHVLLFYKNIDKEGIIIWKAA